MEEPIGDIVEELGLFQCGCRGERAQICSKLSF